MRGYPPHLGPTRAAPAHFPYAHPTLAEVWAREGTMVSVPKVTPVKSFCDQCDRRVSAKEAQRCGDRHCKGARA